MVTSVARVVTDRPERYLEQICKHASAMGAGGHAARMHGGEHQASHDRDVQVASSENEGQLTFAAWGTCTLTAEASTLTLRVEAKDEDGLRRIQDILSNDLDRFGRRDGLVVAWQDR
jgi:hypothetical protein